MTVEHINGTAIDHIKHGRTKCLYDTMQGTILVGRMPNEY